MDTNILEKISDIYVLFLNSAWEDSIYVPENFQSMNEKEKQNYHQVAKDKLKQMLTTDIFDTLVSWSFDVKKYHYYESFDEWIMNNINLSYRKHFK